METKPGNLDEPNNNKQQPDTADSKTDMLQHEKLIDPGNEHSHHVDDEKKLMRIKKQGLMRIQ